jgi:bifunctional UDP-N-acetylglucosamine pyrophosphorylase / glucosamine-1-phosphate N-acetyltransferase
MDLSATRKLGAIILAAGKGKRMKAKHANKVTMKLADKPLIMHSIHVLEEMEFSAIVVVVGFAKESVKHVLQDSQIIFAEQTKRLGTGHAVKVGLMKVPDDITDVLVIQGDDSHFYKKEIIEKLAKAHISSEASLTFLTINVSNPQGLGRIVRDNDDKVVAVVEEKDATEEERKITEVNPACYLFSVPFLKKYLPKIPKSPVTGEYYLPSLIDIAITYKEPIETVQVGHMPWRGVNTPEELAEAEQVYKQLHV